MNITIINCFDTWEHRVDLLLKVMKGEGHNVQVLTSDYCHIKKSRRFMKKENYRFFTVQPYKKNISLKRLYSHIQFSRDVFSYIDENKENIDVLWILAPPNILVKYAGITKQKYPHIRLVIDLIDLWPETIPFGTINQLPIFYAWQRLRDKYLGYANMVVTECNYYQHVLGKNLKGIKTQALYLAREDKGYMPKLNLADDKIVLCYLGSINNIIDISSIEKIIKMFCGQRPVVFHIVGDGEKKSKLINASKKAGAEVIFHGAVYDRKVKKNIFDSCHYGLNIMKDSVCVGLTMKSIDYFEFGLPIINNIKGDTWKIIEKYGCGFNYESKKIQFNIDINNKQRLNSRIVFEKYLTEDIFKREVMEILENIDKRVVQRKNSNYGISETIRNAATVFINKIQYPSARFIRYPIIIRGKKYIDFGKGLTTGYNCRIEVNGKHARKVLIFGDNVNIGDNVSIRCAEKVTIGNNVLMGSRVLIIDNIHGNYSGDNQDSPNTEPNKRMLTKAPIIIGDNVWIGEGVVIQAGVTIGTGSIIAANSVVTRDIASGLIAGGVPAKAIKKYDRRSKTWKRIEKE